MIQENDYNQAKRLLNIRSEHRLRSENLPFDIDCWYPLVSSFTFETRFLPLKRSEAQAIRRFYETRFNDRRQLTASDVTVLQNLEKSLEQELERFKAGLRNRTPDQKVFIRLCGRSMKDGEPLDRAAVVAQYDANLAQLEQQGKDMNDPNTKLTAFSRVNYLSVRNAKEAMSLLLSSERVFSDLNDWLRYGEPEQIVFRRDEPELSLDNEFRVFVWKNNITAISQYDHYGYYPEMIKNITKVESLIMHMWKAMHPLLGVDSYVIDFGYLPHQDRVIMIELSPFRTCTGAACFRWSNSRDVAILQNDSPTGIEVRYNTSVVHAGLQDLVDVNIEHRFRHEHVPPYWQTYALALPSPIHQASLPHRLYLQTGRTKALILLFLVLLPFVINVRNDRSPVYVGVSVAWVLALFVYWYYSVIHSSSQGYSYLLFVYGTLKTGFHWNTKFLSRARFVGRATTAQPQCLVVGDSGVPYMLLDPLQKGKHVQGELWQLSLQDLGNLDEYEGTTKNYYDRKQIPVIMNDGTNATVSAHCYFKVNADSELSSKPCISEYTLHMHQTQYNAIKHISVKQHMYLGEKFSS